MSDIYYQILKNNRYSELRDIYVTQGDEAAKAFIRNSATNDTEVAWAKLYRDLQSDPNAIIGGLNNEEESSNDEQYAKRREEETERQERELQEQQEVERQEKLAVAQEEQRQQERLAAERQNEIDQQKIEERERLNTLDRQNQEVSAKVEYQGSSEDMPGDQGYTQNDYDILKENILNGDPQGGYDHMMSNYRNNDEVRNALRSAVLDDPEVASYYERTGESVIGGVGRGGIFAGGAGHQQGNPVGSNSSNSDGNVDNITTVTHEHKYESTVNELPIFNQNAEYGEGSVLPFPEAPLSNDPIKGDLERNEYGIMAEWLYNEEKGSHWGNYTPEGYELKEIVENPDSGYKAAVFLNKETKEMVLIHRGSDVDGKMNDWILQGNFEAAIFDVPHKQLIDAQNLVDQLLIEFPEYNMTNVGHSLGGYLAEVMASRNNSWGISFDPLYAGSQIGNYDFIERTTVDGIGVYELTRNLYLWPESFGNLDEAAEVFIILTTYVASLKDGDLMESHELLNILKEQGIDVEELKNLSLMKYKIPESLGFGSEYTLKYYENLKLMESANACEVKSQALCSLLSVQ